MSRTERNPTEIADCGCPYDPEYDEGSLGWHQLENHIPMLVETLRRNLREALHDLDLLEGALRKKTDVYDVLDEDGVW